ncbi:immunoglobulin-like domain-containing protein [Sporosarcina ureae]|uniref:DUF5011 domain-containing protein n=1 Tax=Sporosarcina ureae TaxID=1571 RepID=A0ABN4YSW5_SPOUR|nr:immunoglobulin-like domain-containing protein [Sporosarcina ureae]ARF14916.1 hypothetical protein SporoS204_12585 [Sporosarcina ureae]
MKKFISITMIFLLTIYSLQPSMPTFAAEGILTQLGTTKQSTNFPVTSLALDDKGNSIESGSLPGSFAITKELTKKPGSNSFEAIITFSSNKENMSVSVVQKTTSGYEYQVGGIVVTTSVNQKVAFPVTQAGIYYIKVLDGGTSVYSNEIKILPPAPTVTSVKGTSKIIAEGGIPGASVHLLNLTVESTNKDYLKESTFNKDGIAEFQDLSVRNGYEAKQMSNGLESTLSNKVTIFPSPAKLKVVKHSGSKISTGEIAVTGIEIGDTLLLYKGSTLESEIVLENLSTKNFNNLAAGVYRVIRKVNEIESDPAEIEILDKSTAPIITLEDAIHHEIEYPYSYVEPGYSAIDSEGQHIKKENIKVVSTIPNTSPPGKYTITYTATDDYGNTAIAIRNVTIFPNTINAAIVHTNEGLPEQRSNGDINITNAIAKATIYVYQDPDQQIKEFVLANQDTYTISLPVGKNYFIIQEVNGVRSKPSERYEVKDTTPPQLKLHGKQTIPLVVGDKYEEYSATATDNVDTALEIMITGSVDTSKPGKYTITYNTRDKAGNFAWTENDSDSIKEKYKRTIIVSPKSVVAIGSTADMGEIGVKFIYPGTANSLTKVTLHQLSSNVDGKDSNIELKSEYVLPSETTSVFTGVKPGRYYVTQTVGTYQSAPSNIVEVIDTDRPYITLTGPDQLHFTWGKDSPPYYLGGNYNDPGANANDYLEGDLTQFITKQSTLDANPTPGVYKIRYNVNAKRGVSADEKTRTVTIAPPAIHSVTSKIGSSQIEVSGIFQDPSTIVSLYDAYGTLVKSKNAEDKTDISFKDVAAGLSYYVTQTVNDIEGGPSATVNVNLHSDAEERTRLSSFDFPASQTNGVIDHNAGTITLTVPADTDVTKLAATFTTENSVPNDNTNPKAPSIKVKSSEQVSGITIQDFTKPVQYVLTVMDVKKTYTVTVFKASNSSLKWKNAFLKNILPSSSPQEFWLTSGEQALAIQNGVSYMSPEAMIHVSPTTLKESTVSNLSVQKVSLSSIKQSGDPSWISSLSNVYDIGWGRESYRFTQPIELELRSTENKSFAKLVRQNGKLYAFLQPTKRYGKNVVGLISEPGMYGLIDTLEAPTIKQSSTENPKRFTIEHTPGITYYSTSSRQVRFDQSSKDLNQNGFFFDGSVTDMTNWSSNSNEPIEANDELYAFRVFNQVVSPVSAFVTPKTTTWLNKGIQSVENHKIWKVSFNARIDINTLYSNSIRVTDDTTGKQVNISLSTSTDGKTVLIVPDVLYERGKQYTLWIDKTLKGNTKNKEFLKYPTKLSFKVK